MPKKNNKDNRNWFDKGLEHIWMPYTQMKTAPDPVKIKHAEGCDIILEDGTKLLDGIASWWSVCHGYQNPYIVKKMEEQLKELSHVMFAGTAHKPAYELANKIAEITPEGLSRVFFADSGSTAVEIAMKMCVQYWHNKGNKRKNKFISFRKGYHGDTMGALSLGDPDGWIAKSFNNYTPRQFVLDIPRNEYALAEFEELIKGIKDSTAGIIIEPLVQGAGGMKFHSPDIVATAYKIAKENDILFIADEIMTGFYRTGLRFACMEAAITPDIMCIGKALTGGMISLAATVTTDEIFNSFYDDKLEKAFMHGPTFMANPLACSAAIASLELFEKDNFNQKAEEIETILIRELEELEENNYVQEVRVKGAIGVVEIKEEVLEGDIWDFMFGLREEFKKHGVWLRPFKNIIYIMPSFMITEKELKKLTSSIKAVLN